MRMVEELVDELRQETLLTRPQANQLALIRERVLQTALND